MDKRCVMILGGSTLLALTATTNVSADDSVTDIAGATGCGILATLLQNPQLAVAASGACTYGTSVAKKTVGSWIDIYFDNKDQDFANKYCLTIVKEDGSMIKPLDKTNCSQ